MQSLSLRVFLLTALVLVACQDSGSSSVESSSASPLAAQGWVQLGLPGDQPRTPLPPLPKAMQTDPGEEAAALGLARTYYPEFFEGEGAVPVPAEAALKVEWPAAEGAAMTLSTRGHVFQVKAGGTGARAPKRAFQGAVFYGPGHFWSMAGQGHQRVEEYVVLPEGTREYRARYEVAVPEGVVAVRDAGAYLEFLDAREVPVLRMHYGVARDAQGLTRQGQTRMKGGVATHRAPARYALVERTLAVDLVLGLEGLRGPIVVDPGWSSTGAMAVGRTKFASTLLPGGKVLIAGGYVASTNSLTAELYDPATGTWSSTGSMNQARYDHELTLLPNGKVLVTGGYTGVVGTPTAELYDPASGGWTLTSPMKASRAAHSTTVLSDGRVLVAGGIVSASLDIAELYDASTGTWTSTGLMPQRHSGHVAVLLANGKVLVAGGSVSGTSTPKAVLYDPLTSTWSSTGSMVTARGFFTGTLLPNGKVLIAGGLHSDYLLSLNTAELYDPVTGTWSATKNTLYSRAEATAALLPNGKVMLVGGHDGLVNFSDTSSGEVYDPTTATWGVTPSMPVGRSAHAATLLADGRLLVMGGSTTAASSRADVFEPSNATRLASGALLTARASPMAPVLPNGKVLVFGGQTAAGAAAPSEVFDPTTSSTSAIAGPVQPRTEATVTLLASGRVLVAGGRVSGVSSALVDQYDPETNTWSATGALGVPRSRQTATLLRDGRVLVVGGMDGTGGPLASAELYDPAAGTWSPTGSLAVAREGHVALPLPNGKVLVAAGNGGVEALASAELYDPATGTWSPTGSLATARVGASGVHLADGRVLVVAGRTIAGTFLASAERYDAGTGTWSAAGSLTTARDLATAMLLPSGQVLVAGGRKDTTGVGLASLELYEPRTNVWTVSTVSLAAGRHSHGAVPLPSGRVLLLGGGGATLLTANEVYDPVGANDAWRPSVTLPTELFQGTGFVASGTRFRGISEAGGGNARSSASDFPAWVSLMPVGGGAITRLTPTAFSGTSLSAVAPGSLPPGYYLLSVTANGIPGGRVVRLLPGTVSAPDLSASTDEDTPVAVTLSASSSLGVPPTFSVLSPPAHGTLFGAAPFLTYMPTTDYFGSDSFRFQASDGTGSIEGVVSLTVRPTPDAPSAYNVSFTTVVGAPVAVTLPGMDPDNDAVFHTVVTGPGEGTLSGSAPNLIYTPSSGFAGTDTFTFKLSDGSRESPVYTATVSVNLPSTAATAVYDSVLGAPQCVGTASSCDSVLLLRGRGQLGPEPNQPNTLGPCLDGMAGTYHVNPSLDRLKVSTLNGAVFTVGKSVQIEATVWAADLYTDKLNLYYSASASSPNWVLIGTYLPPALGAQVIRVNYTLPAQVGVQAIRGVYYSGGQFNGACVYSSGLMDHDDLSFPVAAADAIAPTVALTSPAAGALVGGSVSLTATASDNVGVTRVEFFSGTVLVGTRTAPPYTSTWNTAGVTQGSHVLSARAYDAAGNVGTSASVTVTVGDLSPPQVHVVSLPPGAVRGVVELAFTASDNVGVTRVELYEGDTQVGLRTAPPYVFSWNTVSVANGLHPLRVLAHDAGGNAGAADFELWVDNQLPTVAVTGPGDGTTVSGTVTLTASAVDNSKVLRVDFYVDGALVGSSDSAPHAFSWSSSRVANGTHVLSARAFDAADNEGTSAPVSILVNNRGRLPGPSVRPTRR